MDVIDFHMHLFSRAYFEALATQSPLAGSAADKLAELTRKTGVELPPADVQAHTQRWLKQLDAHGVAHMCAFASAPEEIPSVAEAARVGAGRITPFALVNPTVAGAAEKVDGLIEQHGFRGVLLFPALHHYSIASEGCAPLLRVLHRRGAVAYVHSGLLVVKLRDLLGFPRTADLRFANPLDLIPAANAHSGAHFVIPHFGAGFLRETLLAGAQCPNVYVDTSSSNSWTATHSPHVELRDVFESALRVFGAKRILFGKDSNTFPAGWRADRLAEQLAIVESLGVSPDDRAAIFGGNARRLLQLA